MRASLTYELFPGRRAEGAPVPPSVCPTRCVDQQGELQPTIRVVQVRGEAEGIRSDPEGGQGPPYPDSACNRVGWGIQYSRSNICVIYVICGFSGWVGGCRFDVPLTPIAAESRTLGAFFAFEGLEGARSTPMSEPVIRRNPAAPATIGGTTDGRTDADCLLRAA